MISDSQYKGWNLQVCKLYLKTHVLKNYYYV